MTSAELAAIEERYKEVWPTAEKLLALILLVKDVPALAARIRQLETVAGSTRIEHGFNCRKLPHGPQGGYLHDEDYNGPYDVDGVMYCGRCHLAL